MEVLCAVVPFEGPQHPPSARPAVGSREPYEPRVIDLPIDSVLSKSQELRQIRGL